MTQAPSVWLNVGRCAERQIGETWDSLWRNNLWKRMLKNVIATTIVVVIALIPGAQNGIGPAGYLGCVATVFGHPGRRFGQMAEANILVVSGVSIGVGWSVLGLHLSSLVVKENPSAAFAIKGIFNAVMAMLFGYLRSKFPRLFLFALLMVFVSTVILSSTAMTVTVTGVTQILYPILIAVGILLLVNLLIFPEFSSSFLGEQTIETLEEAAKALENAGTYFVARKQKGNDKEDKRQDEDVSSSLVTDCATEKLQTNSSNRSRGFSSSVKQRVRSFSTKSKGRQMRPERPEGTAHITIKEVTAAKEKIRNRLRTCKAAQQECNFEIFVGVLPPFEMKPISSRGMKRLVASIISVIGTCESKFALLGEEEDLKDKTKNGPKQRLDNDNDNQNRNGQPGSYPPKHKVFGLFEYEKRQEEKEAEEDPGKAELEVIKPKREIEFGDERLLRYLVAAISKPYLELYKALDQAFLTVNSCIAYVYGVTKLPSGLKTPKGITLGELDTQVEALQLALGRFDNDFAAALESANALEELRNKEPDIMPRDEVFLISSFMLNVRQVGTHVEDMLQHARELVNYRNQRHGSRRIYAPRIKWSKWLFSGGDEDEALPSSGRKANRTGQFKDQRKDEDTRPTASGEVLLDGTQDIERNVRQRAPKGSSKPTRMASIAKDSKQQQTLFLRLRGKAADCLEGMQASDDLAYALKLSVAVFLVLWPAFVASWNKWFSLNRGLWAALQLIFILEVSIGTSVLQFITRIFGTTLGCLWGWASVGARGRNPIVCAAMVFIGQFPFVYVQLATKYPKGGMVGIVSITVVALASELDTGPEAPTQNFLKRYIAFLIGGVVALLVEVMFLPVKARTRMVESIASALQQISEMEKCIAIGIDEGVKLDVVAEGRQKKFDRATAKANAALGAAETFLPFCATEPRLKGPFSPQAQIYTEVLFVLHQIVDRMENMLNLRTKYGSGPLEEFNTELYAYRRNVAGSITLTLFSIQSALSTKLPLPQFMPSARLAHLRMINKVREVVLRDSTTSDHVHSTNEPLNREIPTPSHHLARQRAVRRKYLSWNASSAAQAEIIEFLEELIDLTKLLVGANEFRSGLFVRPQLRDYYNDGGVQQRPSRDTVSDDEGFPKPGDGEMPTHAFGPFDGAGEQSQPAASAPAMKAEGEEEKHTTHLSSAAVEQAIRRRRQRVRDDTIASITSSGSGGGDEIPASLVRIQTRKREAGMRRASTREYEKRRERASGREQGVGVGKGGEKGR